MREEEEEEARTRGWEEWECHEKKREGDGELLTNCWSKVEGIKVKGRVIKRKGRVG